MVCVCVYVCVCLHMCVVCVRCRCRERTCISMHTYTHTHTHTGAIDVGHGRNSSGSRNSSRGVGSGSEVDLTGVSQHGTTTQRPAASHTITQHHTPPHTITHHHTPSHSGQQHHTPSHTITQHHTPSHTTTHHHTPSHSGQQHHAAACTDARPSGKKQTLGAMLMQSAQALQRGEGGCEDGDGRDDEFDPNCDQHGRGGGEGLCDARIQPSRAGGGGVGRSREGGLGSSNVAQGRGLIGGGRRISAGQATTPGSASGFKPVYD